MQHCFSEVNRHNYSEALQYHLIRELYQENFELLESDAELLLLTLDWETNLDR